MEEVKKKVMKYYTGFSGRAIADVDLNKSEPWDLPGKAKMGEKNGYGGEMNNGNTMNSSVMVMDHCADLDNYWATVDQEGDGLHK
ncbi:hypothetical protein HAX54_005973 [Datura stramonium]|uniref:Uncharacterized protein n=1 Tax=Datura stramonium TaxID=4076 RepID=A0ABS8RJ89_DATST|nr:hypothetical protein [Datura stramonium]